MNATQYQDVQLEIIFESPMNPRKYFDPLGLAELSESIKQVGIIEPVLLRPAGNTYELVVGARRFRASKMAGKTTIPAMIRELTDDEVFEIQITENLQRQDVHPLEEAEGFKKMLDSGKYTAEDIRLKFGVTPTLIAQRLKLNDLIPEIKDIFFNKTIMLVHAVELAKLEPEDQLKIFKNVIIEEHWDGNKSKSYVMAPTRLRDYIHRNIALLLDKAPFSKKDPSLNPVIGACTTCPRRSGYNKTLFHDIQDKDRCFNPGCFTTKMDNYIKRQISDLKEAQEKYSLIILTTYVDAADKKKYPGILQEYHDYKSLDKKNDCDHVTKGLIVAGENIGKLIRICSNKKCTEHWTSFRSNSDTSHQGAKAEYEQKKKRGRELDAEKVHARIIESLQEHPVFSAKDEIMNKSEQVGMLLLAFHAGDYHVKEKQLVELGWAKGNSFDSNKVFFEKIKICTPEERAFIFRKLVLEKFKNFLPTTEYGKTEAAALREMAVERTIPVEVFEEQQAVIRDKREARMEIKYKEQLEEEKKAKLAAGKKIIAEGESKGKKDSVLVDDPNRPNIGMLVEDSLEGLKTMKKALKKTGLA